MSAHKDFALAPRASGSVSWVETLVISALALGLGWWFSPDDPLQVNATFPWVILAPLLLGMRYGFVRGLASAALLVAALFAFRVQGVEAYAQVPAAFIVGVLLCAMLVGEFRDIWERRLERLELANEYRQLRLDEFTRAHHILRISHDRLEQRVAGNDQSLRSSLLGLRQLLRELPSEEAPLDALAETVLALLAQYGSLRIAGLYRVRHDRTPEPQPLATLGEMPALDADDLLVRTCLERGELVSVRQELLERGEQRAHSALQVCVPLVDTDGGSSPCWRWSRCRSSSSTNVPSACWRSSPGTSPTCCRATVAHCNWPTSTPSASPSTSSAPCWTPATMGCRPACMPSS